MKNILITVALCSTFSAAIAQEKPELIIYTYDSFVADWGPGPQVKQAFEAICECELSLIPAGDGAALLARMQLEGDHSDADIILGLDANLIERAQTLNLFRPYAGARAEYSLPIEWNNDTFIPYDWGYFAFIYDNNLVQNPPSSFAELIDSDLTIILQDPRSSSPGLGLLLWVEAVFGAQSDEIWEGLAPRIVTVTAGWTESYGLFLEGEADMVLSYSTSPAYHRIAEEDDSKSAALFSDGHAMQIEVAAILANSDQPELADEFISFMTSGAFQQIIPTTNWMYPAVQSDLPAGFDTGFLEAVTPAQILSNPEQARLEAIQEWREILSR